MLMPPVVGYGYFLESPIWGTTDWRQTLKVAAVGDDRIQYVHTAERQFMDFFSG